jgi:pimeloyl-ACP methyl ester carboxylesterase
MAPVAEALADRQGILEPFQNAFSIAGQIEELAETLRLHAAPPVILIGHSWGAWLSAMVAAALPSIIGKVLMVDAGPLIEEYATDMKATRLRRLSAEERREATGLEQAFTDGATTERSFARFGELMERADAFDPLPGPGPAVRFRPDIYRSVWPEGVHLRRSGELLRMCRAVRCPVVAIHGDHDPHPVDGVRVPLRDSPGGFRCHLLQECGHTPWRERRARDAFFTLLRGEIASPGTALR